MNKHQNRFKSSENFMLSEHQCQGERYGTCKCGGAVKMDERLATIEQKIRDRVGKPLTKTSGYRCWEHNASIKGASPISQHVAGTASDISVEGTGLTVDQLAEIAKECGAVRIGKYPNNGFVHISCEEQIKVNGDVAADTWTIL